MRDFAGPDLTKVRAELERVDRELTNVVDGLAKLGTSAALLARVRSLEADKAKLTAQVAAQREPPRIIPNVERVVRERVAMLEETFAPLQATGGRRMDDGIAEKGRAEIRQLLGDEIRVVEDGEDVFAEVNLSRVVYISHGAGRGT